MTPILPKNTDEVQAFQDQMKLTVKSFENATQTASAIVKNLKNLPNNKNPR
jgi:hypothetical protein